MEQAVIAVIDDVIGTANLFDVPCTSFYRKVKSKQKIICGENEISSTSIGCPTVFSSISETTFVETNRYPEAINFGVTPRIALQHIPTQPNIFYMA